VLVPAAALERAGLRRLEGNREEIDGESYVSLRSLALAVRYQVDERALALRLQVEPALFDRTVIDLQPGRPPGLKYRQDPAGFLNYAATWSDVSRYTAFVEAGISGGGALLFSSAARTPDGALIRGLSTLTFDDRPRLTRWLVGDQLVTLSDLSGSLVLGGVAIFRDFDLDPYLIRYPTFGLSGAAPVASTADVYVNGTLVRRETLPSGPFELNNVPVPTGTGAVRVVVRDPFGREQEIVSPYYFTSALLAPGLHDYSYNVGSRRDHLTTSSGDYATPAFLARHRVGIMPWLTAGLRAEAGFGFVSGGPLATARLPLGELAMEAAGSRADDHPGWATSVAYTLAGRPLSVGAAVRMLSARYATTSLESHDDRARLQVSAFVGLEIGARTSLTLGYAKADFRDQEPRERVTAFLSVRVTDRASLLVSSTYHIASPAPSPLTPRQSATEVFAGVSYYFGNATTGSLSHEQRGSERTSTVELQRSLPVGDGVGYRLRAATARDQTGGGGAVQYQGPYGRYEVAGDVVDGHGSTALSVAGGLVAIGGAVYPTRPVQDSFALIRVPGVGGVRGYADNEEIGRTNARGDLLIPSLRPDLGNRLRIADEDIPLDRFVEETEQTVAAPFRGGAVVRFPVGRLQAVTGRLLVEAAGRVAPPGFGELSVTVGGRQADSPIGRDGEFYLENVPTGRYPALIVHDGLTCEFVLEVPPTQLPLVEVGTLRCRIPGDTGGAP
jgi:outer membrane usher protein